MVISRAAVPLALAALALAVPRSAATAQTPSSCAPIVTRTAPGPLSGARIDSVRIVTLPPDPLPGPAAMVEHLHVRTQERIIRRQVRFAAGDTVDTLRIADAMRHLRQRRYLADAWLEARPCNADGGVTLTLTTRDSWSTRPEMRLGASGSATVGLEERNLFGTGRAASLYVRSSRSRLGVGAMVSDPWVPHTNLTATARIDSYSDGQQWLATASTRRFSIFDPWRTELTFTGSTYHGTNDTSGVFTREWANVLVSHVVHTSPYGVTSLLMGGELARSSLYAGPAQSLLGPANVLRRFVGLDLGLRRESASYDTLSWLLPHHAFADVPTGFEWDAVAGFGTDLATHTPALHADLWGGRVWTFERDHVLVADVWSSGFLQSGAWNAATVRGHVSYFAAAPHGLWQAHVAAERLFDPDPDVRALATLDPLLPLFPHDARLAEGALSASVERDIDIRKLSHSWALQGALFGAASSRNDFASPNPEQLSAAAVGLGLRLTPMRPGRATFRVDAGFPVARSATMRRGPYVSVLVIPWLGGNRERDGRLQ